MADTTTGEARHITVSPFNGTVTVEADGTVLARSDRALALVEGGHGTVYYVPREDLQVSATKTARTSTCPWKGMASYWTLDAGGRRLDDVAWSYETPKAGVAEIAGHVAFWPDRVTIRAEPRASGFAPGRAGMG